MDHVYTLKTIIELYLCQGRRLFCAFVDYKKAFDSIDRVTLWKKLVTNCITGNFLNVVKSMYSSVKSCIKYNGETSEYFAADRGLRQGENLSPILFSMFLNDIENFFMDRDSPNLSYIENLNNNCDATLDELLNMFIILYADDTVILAEDEKALQEQLNLLCEYCTQNSLSVNIDKTKIMVFARSKCRIKKLPSFTYGEIVLELVEDYLYLGVKFNWNGSFVKAKKYMFDKALKAMFCIIEKGRRLSLPIDVMFKLFDTCVSPILMYGCEVWGYENVDILESLHSLFCKVLMKVTKYSHNLPVFAELGRYSMLIQVKRRMLNFWARIISGKQMKLSFVMYQITRNLYMKGRHDSPWLLFVKKTLDECGLTYVWMQQAVLPTKAFSGQVKRILCDQYQQTVISHINNDDQYVNLRMYKSDVKCEKYLCQLDESLIYSIFQFRIGSYLLPVNMLSNVPFVRNSRVCTACNMVGDELHFIYECLLLSELRKQTHQKCV